MFANGVGCGATNEIRGFFAPLRMTRIISTTSMIFQEVFMATAPVVSSVRRAAPALPIYWKETKYEFLKLLRTQSFSLSVIGFPVMFYVLFGVANRHASEGSVHIAKLMLGGYACFGMVGAALFGV